MPKKKEILTPKQKVFCHEYAKTSNGTQSALIAGYAKGSAGVMASRLLSQDKIQDYIQTIMDAAAEKAAISVSYVLETVQQTIERCRQLEDTGKKDHLGHDIYLPADVQGIYRGTEQLGRHLKMFTDKVEHSTGLENMSQAELDRELARIKAEVARLDQDDPANTTH